MARSRIWEWNKSGDFDGHASFHAELPGGVELDAVSAPTATLEQRTVSDPETWVDRTSEVTITATIVDALDPVTKLAVSGGTNRGVRVVITADPDPQPDVTDEPEPGNHYRVTIAATRSDTSRPFARDVKLRILP